MMLRRQIWEPLPSQAAVLQGALRARGKKHAAFGVSAALKKPLLPVQFLEELLCLIVGVFDIVE
jgi:hypothetical protein